MGQGKYRCLRLEEIGVTVGIDEGWDVEECLWFFTPTYKPFKKARQ